MMAKEDDLRTVLGEFVTGERGITNAIKALGKGNQEAVQFSDAYQELVRIGTIYKFEGALKALSPEERLKERQDTIKPLVEKLFVWVKEQAADGTVLAKGETAKGLNFCINQREQHKVSLTDERSQSTIPLRNAHYEISLSEGRTG